MKLTIRHTLTFSLGTPARAVQHLLLTPLATSQQKIERWSIEMPGIAGAAVFRDGFGNRAHLVSQIKPEPRIVVTAGGVVETIDRAGVLGRLDLDPMPAMFRRQTLETHFDPALIEGLAGVGDRIAMLHGLMGRLHATHPAQAQMQAEGGQTQAQSGETAPRGLALAFVGAARALGVPARYVTGYLLGEDGKASVHAWAEACDEGLGWIGFDPALDVCPTENHVRLACGLDATGTTPVRSVPVWSEAPVETIEIEAS